MISFHQRSLKNPNQSHHWGDRRRRAEMKDLPEMRRRGDRRMLVKGR
jgi:hypothetical protein